MILRGIQNINLYKQSNLILVKYLKIVKYLLCNKTKKKKNVHNKKRICHINHRKIKNNEYKIDEILLQIIIQMVEIHVRNAFLIM